MTARKTQEEMQREIDRLRGAISWALGECPPNAPEFTARQAGDGAYWWRKKLSILAGRPKWEYNKDTRTLSTPKRRAKP